MTRRTRFLGLLLLTVLALTLAPHVVGTAKKFAPYLTGEARGKTNELQSHAASVNANDQQSMQTSYEQDAKRIKSLDSARKLSEVQELIQAIKLKWSGTSGPHYGLLMLDTCKTLNSVDFGDKRQYELAYANAVEMLGQLDRLPQDPEQLLDAETGFVLCLNHDLGDPAWTVSPNWAARRRLNAEKFLSLWQRIKNGIDPTFNSKDRPLLNVPAPVGSGLTAGSDPANIVDPGKRAEYEAAIRANREKAQTYNLQQRLRALAPVFQSHLKGYLVAAYSKEPANNAELEALLSQYHVDESIKAEIRKELTTPAAN